MSSKPSVIPRGMPGSSSPAVAGRGSMDPRQWRSGMTSGGFFLILLLPFISFAKGIMPPKASESPPAPSPYLLIGATIPESLTVLDLNGKTRTLWSYKAPIEVLVLGFYSPRCEANQKAWRKLKILYENYEEWHVAFLGVSSHPDETAAELSEAMKKAELPYEAVRDEGGNVARALNITALPEIVIIDEWSQVRYRGPINKADRALQNVISHQEAVPNPEPAFEGCAIQ